MGSNWGWVREQVRIDKPVEQPKQVLKLQTEPLFGSGYHSLLIYLGLNITHTTLIMTFDFPSWIDLFPPWDILKKDLNLHSYVLKTQYKINLYWSVIEETNWKSEEK